ncbi:MAG: ribonuclease HII [Woeseia sp.]
MKSWRVIAGVDEAGRGPLAGPVMAAAVILDPAKKIAGLADSKKLSPARREALAEVIQRDACAFAVAWADAEEIDRLNILVASHLAMRRALSGLRVMPDHVEVDGNRLPNLRFPARQLTGTAIVGGDASVAAISAASILAKVLRDRTMLALDALYPEYGFAQHKGYPTKAHRAALERHGPCPQHRRSFRPLSMPA